MDTSDSFENLDDTNTITDDQKDKIVKRQSGRQFYRPAQERKINE